MRLKNITLIANKNDDMDAINEIINTLRDLGWSCLNPKLYNYPIEFKWKNDGEPQLPEILLKNLNEAGINESYLAVNVDWTVIKNKS